MIQKLIRQAAALSTQPLHTESLLPLVNIMDKIRPEELDIKSKISKLNPLLEYSSEDIYTHPAFQISLFLLPAENQLPLHDHPGMTVLSRVLTGKIQIRAFDWATEYPYSGLARPRLDTTFDPASPTIFLLPNYWNLHEVTALTDCAFLDVFFPYYNESEGRGINYYEAVEVIRQRGEDLVKLQWEPL